MKNENLIDRVSRKPPQDVTIRKKKTNMASDKKL